MRALLAFVICLLSLPAAADPPRVVTDIAVTRGLVQDVLGDLGTAEVLVSGAGDPHGFQLRPSQARALSASDLVVWVGPELTPGLEASLGALSGEVETLRLLEIDGLKLRAFGEGHHDAGHDHAHDHGHGNEHDHGQGQHDEAHHGGVDPHAWLNPENAAHWSREIGAALARQDPENADVYTANAERAAARYMALLETVSGQLAPFRDRPIVVLHDAYGYFAEAFGVDVAGSVKLADAREPGLRHILELRGMIDGRNVECLFREPQHRSDLAEQIAADMGLRLGTLDPVGAKLDSGPETYERLIRGMARSIIACLEDAEAPSGHGQ